MSDLEFSVPEFNLLLSLVHLRGSGTTGKFKIAFGYDKVEPAAQKSLTDKGLISIDRGTKPFTYELTDPGWLAVRELLPKPAPAKISQKTARILWAVIQDFSAHMDRAKIELADIYPEPEPVAETLADRIIATYRELTGDTADWVPLLALRERLDDAVREEVDKVLAELHTLREIQLIPESNQKTLTDADRAAALWLGGESRHLIGIEVR
ncbi:hypothetical protein [Glycomyces artemisiae]|uniref:Uncharacterized protein n=1 Tax=Glycomyces artemisiae TaxID=1076443 RepID=A0A2T0U813_9ACTN|nr:hypothetical protein [Glycomyces artemisiae]PRY54060.1 hypothetical protein B0I28_11621 [Glycomyces artemisiae]